MFEAKLLKEHPMFWGKYVSWLDKPDKLAGQIQSLTAMINRTEDVAKYNYLVDELDAVGDFYDAALTIQRKKDDERRLKEFYEVLIYD